MTIFADSFRSDTPKDSLNPLFTLKAENVFVQNLDFKLINENNQNPLKFSASNVGGNLEEMAIVGADFSAKARGLYFKTNQGIQVTNLTTNYRYGLNAMYLNNMRLETENSNLIGDLLFKYKIGGLADFSDAVNIEANFKESKVKILDLKKFYKELNGGDVVSFSGKLNGNLNDFDLKKLILTTEKG
ncbi:MAG: translocation/assembly module TamB domain-containing protein, partial [Flavobacteriales bacterium]